MVLQLGDIRVTIFQAQVRILLNPTGSLKGDHIHPCHPFTGYSLVAGLKGLGSSEDTLWYQKSSGFAVDEINWMVMKISHLWIGLWPHPTSTISGRGQRCRTLAWCSILGGANSKRRWCSAMAPFRCLPTKGDGNTALDCLQHCSGGVQDRCCLNTSSATM